MSHKTATIAWEVWHAEKFEPFQDGRNFPEGYIHVADIAVESASVAVYLTQHLDERDWLTHAAVTAYVPSARSTSVGDVLVREGHALVVAPVGFNALRGR
jgi:hypothetical protein